MKLIVNGGLHCSTLDGWWDEAYEPQLGWAIGDRSDHDGQRDADDASALYDLLEGSIAREFYDRDGYGIPRAWVDRVRASMTGLTVRFSSDRMVREYTENAYLPSALAVRRRTADGGLLGTALEAWARQVGEAWGTIRFGRISAEEVDGGTVLRLEVYLGDVEADTVRVEAFADGDDAGRRPTTVPLLRERSIAGAVNGHLFSGILPTDRPVTDFTPRVVPWHEAAIVPLEHGSIAWGPRPPAVAGVS